MALVEKGQGSGPRSAGTIGQAQLGSPRTLLRHFFADEGRTIKDDQEQVPTSADARIADSREVDSESSPLAGTELPEEHSASPLQILPDLEASHGGHAGRGLSRSSPAPYRPSPFIRSASQPRNLYVVGLPPGMRE